MFTPICVLVTAALLWLIEELHVSLGEKCKWTVLSPAKLLWWPHGHHESLLVQCGWWRNNPNRKCISLEWIHHESFSSSMQCKGGGGAPSALWTDAAAKRSEVWTLKVHLTKTNLSSSRLKEWSSGFFFPWVSARLSHQWYFCDSGFFRTPVVRAGALGHSSMSVCWFQESSGQLRDHCVQCVGGELRLSSARCPKCCIRMETLAFIPQNQTQSLC